MLRMKLEGQLVSPQLALEVCGEAKAGEVSAELICCPPNGETQPLWRSKPILQRVLTGHDNLLLGLRHHAGRRTVLALRRLGQIVQPSQQDRCPGNPSSREASNVADALGGDESVRADLVVEPKPGGQLAHHEGRFLDTHDIKVESTFGYSQTG